MKNFKRFLATLLAVLMALGSCAFAESGAKWTETKMADGWVKVENQDGPTLGYSPDSGITILEDDGYAFKDLNKNGKLDIYEDWRLDDDIRAADIVSKMTLEDMIGLILYPDIFTVESDGSKGYDNPGNDVTTLIDQGQRSYLSFATTYPAVTLAKLANNLNAYAEKTSLGIPMNIASNPQAFGSPGNLALGATFDTEMANMISQYRAQMYRATGVTTELGPQVEIAAEPRWTRVSGTYGEDPALSRDMTNAVISGLQSTYAKDGTDLGWGVDSVIGMMKHFPGDGSGEGGRESHSAAGAYNVYPGEQFETALIPFMDGGLKLDSLTEESAAVMLNMSISYSDDESYGVLRATPFSLYKINLLRNSGYDGVICTDWLASLIGHGTADLTQRERQLMMIENGVDQIGPDSNPDHYKEVHQLYSEKYGEEAANERFRDSARRVVRTFFYTGSFENPYLDSSLAQKTLNNSDAAAFFREASLKSIVMLKNKNTIKAVESSEKKATVYIPMLYTPSEQGYMFATRASWNLPVDLKTAERYFNVVSDTVKEPSGELDKDGNPTYTLEDVERASAEELAKCDFALVIANSPRTTSGYDDSTQTYIPITLQYREYIANSEGVRSESISGNLIESKLETPYGVQTVLTKENRSYYGKSATSNHEHDLDAILYASEQMGDKPVIVAVNATGAFCVHEFESVADAILVGFGIDNTLFLEIAAGKYEPQGLLPVVMPKDMAAVEVQLEDVPRDTEPYMDAEGNVYDFAFGLNWSGVINDERVAKYSVVPLTKTATPLIR